MVSDGDGCAAAALIIASTLKKEKQHGKKKIKTREVWVKAWLTRRGKLVPL